eukprot:143458-Amphidinium_carterae.1
MPTLPPHAKARMQTLASLAPVLLHPACNGLRHDRAHPGHVQSCPALQRNDDMLLTKRAAKGVPSSTTNCIACRMTSA